MPVNALSFRIRGCQPGAAQEYGPGMKINLNFARIFIYEYDFS